MPVPAWIALACLVVAFLAFGGTRFGRYVTGIGANAEAVRRAGVNVARIRLCVYAISGTASPSARPPASDRLSGAASCSAAVIVTRR